ncbi:MAG: hypothetical protein U9O66_00530 [Patescibacteria group bacterium]|nr:hypothetical protein [Patescibacteria group bacterium]
MDGTVSIAASPADTTAPTLTQDTAISSPTNDNTPDYSFHSNEGGSVSYGGSCISTTNNVSIGTTTITFAQLDDGTYNNCTIIVTDSANNASDALSFLNLLLI